MGAFNFDNMFTREAMAEFYSVAVREKRSLMQDIADGAYVSSDLTMGNEIEGSFVRQSDFQLPQTEDFPNGVFNSVREIVKERGGDLAAELGDFDFEVNTRAKTLTGSVFRDEEKEIATKMAQVEAAAHQRGLTTLLSGLTETARREDLVLAHLVQDEQKNHRYGGINQGVMRSRGGPIDITIANHAHTPAFKNSFDHIMADALCAALQTHIKLRDPALDFARYMNASLILAAPIIAASASTPFVLGEGPLWADSRISVFEQSIDWRSPEVRSLESTPCNFPNRYYSNIGEFYGETLKIPVLIPDLSFGKNAAGKALISSPSFRLMVGTDWRWVRPVWHQGNDEKRYMTLEFRPMSSGPTVVDMVANAALYLGAVHYLAENSDPATKNPVIPYLAARNNFYVAARDGLDALLFWRGRNMPAREVVRETLDFAKEGHALLGIDSSDSKRYLGIIKVRCCMGTPGDIKTAEYQDYKQRNSDDRWGAMEQIVRASHTALHRGITLTLSGV